MVVVVVVVAIGILDFDIGGVFGGGLVLRTCSSDRYEGVVARVSVVGGGKAGACGDRKSEVLPLL